MRWLPNTTDAEATAMSYVFNKILFLFANYTYFKVLQWFSARLVSKDLAVRRSDGKHADALYLEGPQESQVYISIVIAGCFPLHNHCQPWTMQYLM